MRSLSGFYEFMDSLQTVRRTVTGYYLMQAHHPRHIRSLENALSAIDALPGDRLDKRLDAEGRTVTVTVDYERGELEKDIHFLTHSDEEFLDYLSRLHDGFDEEVERTVQFLRSQEIHSFVTDRDGTVNNYCGRYRSSHQSVWNAAYLTQFVRAVPAVPVLLTSAPLFEEGLLAMSAMPDHSTNYAGSLGREYCDREGHRGALELSDDQGRAIEELNSRIDALLSRREFATFALIGSGLQHKYGQTTVARQDIHGSIPEELSAAFLEAVRSTVRDIDDGVDRRADLIARFVLDGVFPDAADSSDAIPRVVVPSEFPAIEEEEPADSRGRLIRNGMRLIGERAYHEIGVADIARETGLAVGTFYSYFSSKEEFLSVIVEQIGRQTRRYLSRQARTHATRLEREAYGVWHFLSYFNGHPEYYSLVREAEFVAKPWVRRYYDAFEAGYMENLPFADEAERRVAANFLMGLSHYVGIEALLNRRILDIPAFIAELTTLMCTGVQP